MDSDMNRTIEVSLDDAGRILIPAKLRNRLGLTPGMTLVVETGEKDSVRLRPQSERPTLVDKDGILAVKSDEWRARLEIEADHWYARPPEERQPYLGQYVAVHDKKVVDHDADRRTLYLRIRARFPNTPVLLVRAEARFPSEFTILSPHLERVSP